MMGLRSSRSARAPGRPAARLTRLDARGPGPLDRPSLPGPVRRDAPPTSRWVDPQSVQPSRVDAGRRTGCPTPPSVQHSWMPSPTQSGPPRPAAADPAGWTGCPGACSLEPVRGAAEVRPSQVDEQPVEASSPDCVERGVQLSWTESGPGRRRWAGRARDGQSVQLCWTDPGLTGRPRPGPPKPGSFQHSWVDCPTRARAGGKSSRFRTGDVWLCKPTPTPLRYSRVGSLDLRVPTSRPRLRWTGRTCPVQPCPPNCVQLSWPTLRRGGLKPGSRGCRGEAGSARRLCAGRNPTSGSTLSD